MRRSAGDRRVFKCTSHFYVYSAMSWLTQRWPASAFTPSKYWLMWSFFFCKINALRYSGNATLKRGIEENRKQYSGWFFQECRSVPFTLFVEKSSWGSWTRSWRLFQTKGASLDERRNFWRSQEQVQLAHPAWMLLQMSASSGDCIRSHQTQETLGTNPRLREEEVPQICCCWVFLFS